MEDFFEENLDLNDVDEQEEVEEVEEDEQEEQEEVEEPKKKKVESKSKKKEEASEEESEEEEEKPVKKKVEKKSKAEPKEEAEETEEGVEEDSEEESEAPDPKSFFEEVDKLTGQPVEVEFGDVDPLTPQGIAIRDKAVREAALDTFLQELEESYPTAYKALQYAYDGGNVADLFKEVATRDYSKVELKEDDDALATEILREYYKTKGIKNEKTINKMIETAQDSEEGIVTEAKGFLKELQEEQAEKTEKALAAQRQAAGEEKKRDQVLGAAINEVLETGTLSNFKINPKEVNEFRKFVVGSIRRAGEGNYTFTTQVDSRNLEKQLQYLYFQFKKGDISNLVQAKQITKETQKLRLKLQQEQGTKKTTTKEERGKFGSMKDFYGEDED